MTLRTYLPHLICRIGSLCILVLVVNAGSNFPVNAERKNTASNLAELKNAIADSVGGETILLLPGHYGSLRIQNMKLESGISIRSLKSTERAVFERIEIENSSNVSIEMIDLKMVPNEKTTSWTSALLVSSSSHITLSNLTVTGGLAINGVPADTAAGKLDRTGNVRGLHTGRGVNLTKSSHVKIEKCDISQLRNGIVVSQSEHIRISQNRIHNSRSTPLRGGDVNHLIIDRNHFFSFKPWKFGGKGDHGNFVHFWTRPNSQSGPSEHITIKSNFFEQRDGTSLLGIYLDDNNKQLGFNEVNISNNIIYNGNIQGIRIENGSDVLITNNTLLQSSGDKSDGPTVFLRQNSRNIVIKDNVYSGKPSLDLTTDSIDFVNNLIVQKFYPSRDDYMGALFNNPFAGPAAKPWDLLAKPDSVVSRRKLGASPSVLQVGEQE